MTVRPTSEKERRPVTALTDGGQTRRRLPSTAIVCTWVKKSESVETHLSILSAYLPEIR